MDILHQDFQAWCLPRELAMMVLRIPSELLGEVFWKGSPLLPTRMQ